MASPSSSTWPPAPRRSSSRAWLLRPRPAAGPRRRRSRSPEPLRAFRACDARRELHADDAWRRPRPPLFRRPRPLPRPRPSLRRVLRRLLAGGAWATAICGESACASPVAGSPAASSASRAASSCSMSELLRRRRPPRLPRRRRLAGASSPSASRPAPSAVFVPAGSAAALRRCRRDGGGRSRCGGLPGRRCGLGSGGRSRFLRGRRLGLPPAATAAGGASRSVVRRWSGVDGGGARRLCGTLPRGRLTGAHRHQRRRGQLERGRGRGVTVARRRALRGRLSLCLSLRCPVSGVAAAGRLCRRPPRLPRRRRGAPSPAAFVGSAASGAPLWAPGAAAGSSPGAPFFGVLTCSTPSAAPPEAKAAHGPRRWQGVPGLASPARPPPTRRSGRSVPVAGRPRRCGGGW